MRRLAGALLVLLLLAGCGGSTGEGEGTAQLWVTRDRGATLLLEAEVRAGQTVMRALAAEGHFASGSMGPKVDAACRFVEQGGRRAAITSLDHIVEAVTADPTGGAGTVVVPN